MTGTPIRSQHHQTFEDLKQLNDDDTAFGFARDLAPLLDYPHWRNFLQVIEKAKVACERSGHTIRDHFDEVVKMVPLGSGAQRAIRDFRLTRYACYLFVQNGEENA